MGFRFRRSVRLIPGVRLNFSKSGISTSLGGRGATLNIGRGGTRATVGIPGTGLSYTTKLSGPSRQPGPGASAGPASTGQGSPWLGLAVLGGLLLALGMCVSGRSATPAAPAAASPAVAGPTPEVRTIAGDGVNCRASPRTGAVIARLGKGETATVVDQAPDWTKLVHPGGDCWVANALLTGA